MQLQEFNSEGVAPVYGYSRSPVNERAFLIFRKEDTEHQQPIGDYTVLDKEEDLSLSEKKVMNIISLLNGRKRLMELGHETGIRVLYHVIKDGEDDGEAKILFYNLGSKGVSKENALFRFKDKEGVI